MSGRADDLARMSVLDDHGASVPLWPLWKDHIALLVFVRHFG